MFRVAPIVRLLLITLLPLAGTATASEPSPAGTLRATTWDESRLQASELESLLGASVRAVTAQLAGAPAEAELVDLRAVPDSLSGLALDGVGRVRVAGGAWIPLRVTAGYDLSRAELSQVRLRPITEGAAARDEGVESTVLELVNAQVASRLANEFPLQTREVVLLELAATSAGEAHASYRGQGWVQFGTEGQAPLSFSAILDRSSGRLVAFDYDLDVPDAHGQERLDTLAAAH
jgi:hypothetical protein